MVIKFDVINLCELVENRPCLWDKRHDDYRNNIVKEKAWKEIYSFLDDEFENKTSAEKTEIGKYIIYKFKLYIISEFIDQFSSHNVLFSIVFQT